MRGGTPRVRRFFCVTRSFFSELSDSAALRLMIFCPDFRFPGITVEAFRPAFQADGHHRRGSGACAPGPGPRCGDAFCFERKVPGLKGEASRLKAGVGVPDGSSFWLCGALSGASANCGKGRLKRQRASVRGLVPSGAPGRQQAGLLHVKPHAPVRFVPSPTMKPAAPVLFRRSPATVKRCDARPVARR